MLTFERAPKSRTPKFLSSWPSGRIFPGGKSSFVSKIRVVVSTEGVRAGVDVHDRDRLQPTLMVERFIAKIELSLSRATAQPYIAALAQIEVPP
jgi:hypothetical protein